jgi:hypothetical protein
VPLEGNLVMLQLNPPSSETEIHVMGKRCPADKPANTWCKFFTGTIVIYYKSAETATDAVMHDQIILALNACVGIKNTPTAVQSAWLYATDETLEPVQTDIALNGHLTQECARILSVPPHTVTMMQYKNPQDESVLIMGCRQKKSQLQNPWERCMYGPILVMGGTVNEQTKQTTLSTLSNETILDIMDYKLEMEHQIA